MIAPNTSNRPRGYLFVCGVPRSGTTALARCLNRHPRVVLGIERYRHALLNSSSEADYQQELAAVGVNYYCGLFDKGRFFDFRPSDRSAYAKLLLRSPRSTCLSRSGSRRYRKWPIQLYDDARGKYDSVFYVGDKVPDLYRHARFLRETFPGCKVVFLLRNPVAVALSWQARADNPRDKWSHRNGFVEAIVKWNGALRVAMLAKAVLGGDLTVVLFEDMFATQSLRRLLSRLDLDDGEMGDVGDLVKTWQRTAGRDVQACAAQLRYAEEHVDHGTYEWFKKEAQI